MPIRVVYIYFGSDDEEFHVSKLLQHLEGLKSRTDILIYPRLIQKDEPIRRVQSFVNNANLILILISPQLVNSDYFRKGQELKQALKLYEEKKNFIVPIVLTSVTSLSLRGTPFADLKSLPRDAESVTLLAKDLGGSTATSYSEAYKKVAEQIAERLDEISINTENQIRALREKAIFIASLILIGTLILAAIIFIFRSFSIKSSELSLLGLGPSPSERPSASPSASPSPLQKEFNTRTTSLFVCNRTVDKTINVSVAFYAGQSQGWVSQAWLNSAE